MVKDLMTVAELHAATRAKSPFRRNRFRVPVISALERAHETHIGHPEYTARLLQLLEECDDWLVRHQAKKYRRRREAVTTLRGQVKALTDPILRVRDDIDAQVRSRQQQGALTATLSEQARLEQMGLERSPGETNDPRIDRRRAGFRQELLQATVDRAKALNHADADLNVEQIGFLAAKVALKVDAIFDEKIRQRCQVEAMRVLCALLGKDRELAERFRASGVEVVVVPADRPMTDLAQFSSLKGVDITQGSAPSGRTWDETRGVGGLAVGATVYVAITEENLLGTQTMGAALAAGGGCYAARYSTTAHEFAHALHQRAFTIPQNAIITAAYRAATGGVRIGRDAQQGINYLRIPANVVVNGASLTQFLDQLFSRPFVDGPRKKSTPSAQSYYVIRDGQPNWTMLANGTHYKYQSSHELQDCYGAFDEYEYFAQAVSCYLGANGGTDPYTGRPRNNGEAWVRANEERPLVSLIDELFSAGAAGYAKAQLPDTNVEEPATLSTTVKDIIAERKAIKSLMSIEV